MLVTSYVICLAVLCPDTQTAFWYLFEPETLLALYVITTKAKPTSGPHLLATSRATVQGGGDIIQACPGVDLCKYCPGGGGTFVIRRVYG